MSWKKKFVENWGRLGMKFNTMKMEDALDALIDYRGKTPQKSKTGIMTLSAKSVKNNHIDYSQCYFISEEEYEKFMVRGFPKKGDILLTTEAPLGLVARLDRNDVAIAQRLLTLRGKENVLDNDYLLYYLQSPIGQASLKARETGTTVTGIKQAEFRKIEIEIPDYEVQKKVSGILRVIDQKIELNNAINNNLEQQAQAIYQRMFIDNASSDWEEGTLSDIADITMGQSPSGSSYNEDGNGTIFFQGRAEFGFRFPTVRLYTTEPKRMACTNDTLMSVRAPVGDLNVAHTDCCIGRGLAAIHSKNNHQSFVLYTMFSLKKQLDVFNGEGTVFGSINRISLNDMPLIIPSSDKLDEFEALVAPMDAAIRNNYDEICRLEQLRDSLLPKLMSGELDVSDIEL